jgi:pyruvate formate lyase activating enzyme
LCELACSFGVHSFKEGVHAVDFKKCTACGKCIKVCPSSALSMLGYEISAREVMDIVLQDKDYYEISGGGVTFSGGEPTLQPEFLKELLTLAKASGIHTCLETNGYIPKEILDDIIQLVDLFLIDYKITDEELLKKYTGAFSEGWMDALEYINNHNKPVILRMPIIPGINDNPEHFSKAKEIKNKFTAIQKIEIMPYHAIGSGKWEQIGLTYTLPHIPAASCEQTESWMSYVQ